MAIFKEQLRCPTIPKIWGTQRGLNSWRAALYVRHTFFKLPTITRRIIFFFGFTKDHSKRDSFSKMSAGRGRLFQNYLSLLRETDIFELVTKTDFLKDILFPTCRHQINRDILLINYQLSLASCFEIAFHNTKKRNSFRI